MGKKFLLIFMCVVAFPAAIGGRVRRVPVPAECRNLEDCNNLWRHGEAYSCVDGKCACHLQAVFDPLNKNCKCKTGFTRKGNECIAQGGNPAIIPQGPPGPVALNGTSRSAVCTICPENAKCGSNGCECYDNYVLVNNVCKQFAKLLGELCEYDEQCKKNLGGFSECSGTKCVCSSNGVAVLENTSCYAKKDVGDECSFHEQCSHVLHGTCTGNVCLCDPEFVPFNKSCIAVVDKYNATCSESVQCHDGKLGYGSTCKSVANDVNEKTCVCEMEFFYKSSLQQCLLARGLEEECDGKNNDCYLLADGATQNIECNKNSKCVCKKGYRPSEDNRHCENAGVMNKISYFVMVMSLLMIASRW